MGPDHGGAGRRLGDRRPRQYGARHRRGGPCGARRRRRWGVAMTRTYEQTVSGAPSMYADAAIQRIAAANGIEYAHRDVGEGEGALVLLQHFRGNLDNWDPALIDALASSRRVMTFDNTGGGATTGTTPDTIEQMARD